MVASGQRILVVDGLSETTEVLKAVFEPRGHRVNRVRQSQLADSDQFPPNVIIWHAEESHDPASKKCFEGVPQILIGRARLSDGGLAARHLPLPFQYGELLQAIESALQSSLTH